MITNNGLNNILNEKLFDLKVDGVNIYFTQPGKHTVITYDEIIKRINDKKNSSNLSQSTEAIFNEMLQEQLPKSMVDQSDYVIIEGKLYSFKDYKGFNLKANLDDNLVKQAYKLRNTNSTAQLNHRQISDALVNLVNQELNVSKAVDLLNTITKNSKFSGNGAFETAKSPSTMWVIGDNIFVKEKGMFVEDEGILINLKHAGDSKCAEYVDHLLNRENGLGTTEVSDKLLSLITNINRADGFNQSQPYMKMPNWLRHKIKESKDPQSVINYYFESFKLHSVSEGVYNSLCNKELLDYICSDTSLKNTDEDRLAILCSKVDPSNARYLASYIMDDALMAPQLKQAHLDRLIKRQERKILNCNLAEAAYWLSILVLMGLSIYLVVFCTLGLGAVIPGAAIGISGMIANAPAAAVSAFILFEQALLYTGAIAGSMYFITLLKSGLDYVRYNKPNITMFYAFIKLFFEPLRVVLPIMAVGLVVAAASLLQAVSALKVPNPKYFNTWWFGPPKEVLSSLGKQLMPYIESMMIISIFAIIGSVIGSVVSFVGMLEFAKYREVNGIQTDDRKQCRENVKLMRKFKEMTRDHNLSKGNELQYAKVVEESADSLTEGNEPVYGQVKDESADSLIEENEPVHRQVKEESADSLTEGNEPVHGQVKDESADSLTEGNESVHGQVKDESADQLDVGNYREQSEEKKSQSVFEKGSKSIIKRHKLSTDDNQNDEKSVTRQSPKNNQ